MGDLFKMENFFKLKEHGTTVSTEVVAGITTFFAMSYIIFVNPAILSLSGMPSQAVFLATSFGHGIHLWDGQRSDHSNKNQKNDHQIDP